MGIRELRRRLGEAGHGVLMLDFDGTLAPFRTDPSAVEPYPGVTGLLESLVRQGTTRLVIVTGRSVADGLPQLPTAVPLELWGVHGRERRLTDGSYRLAPLPEPALEALVTADDWSAEVEALGCRVERKPGTIALLSPTPPALTTMTRFVPSAFIASMSAVVLRVRKVGS
ncbi:MAG: hypothetical protein J0M16_05085, partial [Gammaproteobacteria bacterium]|nr:hypothetical protein [Gammaproteobacteria bacterium]